MTMRDIAIENVPILRYFLFTPGFFAGVFLISLFISFFLPSQFQRFFSMDCTVRYTNSAQTER